MEYICEECKNKTNIDYIKMLLYYDYGCCVSDKLTAYFCSNECKTKFESTKICRKCNCNDELCQLSDNTETFTPTLSHVKHGLSYVEYRSGKIFAPVKSHHFQRRRNEKHIDKMCDMYCDFCRKVTDEMNYIEIDLVEQYYFVCDTCYGIINQTIVQKEKSKNTNNCVFCGIESEFTTAEMQIPMCGRCNEMCNKIVGF